MRFYLTIPFWLSLLFPQTTAAQTPALPGYIVETFGAANGLASSEIVSLYQDKQDFIWIGTRSGISRYDGRRFQNFEYVNGSRIGSVNSIAEDKEGTLWMATETGLYHWDGKDFVPLRFEGEAAYLPYYFIHFGADGQTWLGSQKGPLAMNDPYALRQKPVESLRLAAWLPTAEHDYIAKYISSSKKGVAIGGLGEVYLYQNKKLRPLGNVTGQQEYLRGVAIDDEGTVYWNNLLSGFHYWNGAGIVKAADSKGYYFDIKKHEGTVQLYSNAGIMQAEAPTKKQLKLVDIEALALRMPSVMLLDKEGSYWLGATEGLFRVKKNPFTVHWKQSLMQSDEIYSLLRRRNGELLLGANRGCIFLMKDTMRVYKTVAQAVPAAEVFNMVEDEEGALWFASGYQGISVYSNGRLKRFTTKNGLPDNTHHAFFKTRRGELWSAGDMGLTRIEKAGKDSLRFRPFFYITAVDYHKVYGVAEAPDGSLWAGGWLGILRLQNDSLQLYSLPELPGQKIFITAFRQAKSGDVWITTRGHGVLLCRFAAGNTLHLIRQFRAQDGLASNNYLSVAFDESGNAWAGSYSGVTALQASSTDGFRIKNFDGKDGFIQKNYQSLHLYADGDTMWALTSSGAVSFVPATLLAQSRKAPLYITSIDLLNTQKSAGEFLVAEEANGGSRYRFPHAVNSIGVQFAVPYYSNPGAVRYYYQLQGLDSAWTSTGSEQNITFRQLPPGRYTLLVKAAIGGSDWTNTASLPFEVKKPWWLQAWTIALVAVGLGTIAFSYIRSREKRVKERERQKTAVEKIRASAYQHELEIQQVVNYFTSAMNRFTNADELLWDVARACISRLGFEDCVIYLLDEKRSALQQKAAWGPKTTDENRIVNPIVIALGEGIVGTVALTGKAEKINDTTKDPRYIVDDAPRLSEITVPVFDGEKLIGVIDSEHPARNFYTDRHLQILTTIASHCGARISILKAEQQSAAARMEALLNKQKALEASLQSMRLQMNPHFLFNALNSIQQMILAGEETTATRFLSKFSKLLRTILTNSDKEEISLKEETELLQLYVELESLRFKESFSFALHVDEDIDAEEVFVPALFFQPMVENAIWHGLMHKEGDRKLFIGFEEKAEGVLLCTIEDNGVGRHASHKNGHEQLHTGKGLSVAKERLQALNEKNATANSLTVFDLKDEDGKAAGTRIEITLHPQ